MKCGCCKGQHETVDQVKDCYALEQHNEAKEFLGAPEPVRPSEGQLNFAHALLRERVAYGVVQDVELTNSIEAAHEYVSGMDKETISEFIGNMKRQPRRSAPTHTQHVTVGEGMYMMGDTVYKVQRAHHGSGHLYAKRLEVSVSGDPGDPEISAGFVYEPGALTLLKPEHKMTQEQAANFGHLYGVCFRCGKILTKEESIARGMGDICAGKEGW